MSDPVPAAHYPHDDGDITAFVAALASGGQVAKVHLQVGRFDATDSRLDGVWSQLSEHRIPVVLHASAVYGVEGGEEHCGVDQVRALLDRHPDLVPIIAHLGAPDYANFLALAEEVPDLRMDTAMVLTEGQLIGRFPPQLLPQLRAVLDDNAARLLAQASTA